MKWLALIVGFALPAQAQEFQFNPPGQLVPGSGQGRADDRVYVPGMRYPIADAPSYPNSQVWGRGGSQGGGGGQCDAANYSYPWWDNYCESRRWEMPLCPSGNGHQGQDIRASTCENRRWWAVAAEDGTISGIGEYSVSLMTDSGTRHRYLHMDPGSLAVRRGQRVSKGDRMGLVSNAFGGTPTTVHLHYDIQQNVNGQGVVYVPTYMSLVRSYEELLGRPAVPCQVIGGDGGILDDQGPCFHAFGPPATWRAANQGNDGGLRWTYAWVNDTPGNWARWDAHLQRAGRYRVSVNVVPAFASSRQAGYRVRHAGQEADLRVDLSQPGPWIRLGTFDFAAGGDQWIAVFDNSGEDRDLERQIIADAVRFEPVREPPMPDPDAGPSPDAAPVRADQGMPEADLGRPPVDMGPPLRDARPPQRDAAETPPDRGVPGRDAAQNERLPRGRLSSGCRGSTGGGGGCWLFLAGLGLSARRRRSERRRR